MHVSQPVGWLTALVLVVLGALHFYWALGGKLGFGAALPSNGDRPLFTPGPLASATVGVLLCCAAVCVLNAAGHLAVLSRPTSVWATRVIAGMFLLRALGDFRYVGFSKRVRDTRFARWDTRLFSPLCVLLGLGAGLVGLA